MSRLFQNKVNFLYPTSPSTQNSPPQPNFLINPICPLPQESGLPNFSLSPRQVSITQVNIDGKGKLLLLQLSFSFFGFFFRFTHREKSNILRLESVQARARCRITFLSDTDNELRVKVLMLQIKRRTADHRWTARISTTRIWW